MTIRFPLLAGLAIFALSACGASVDPIDDLIDTVAASPSPAPDTLTELNSAAANAFGKGAAAEEENDPSEALYQYSQAARGYQALSQAVGPDNEAYAGHRMAMFNAAAEAVDICRDQDYDDRLGHHCAATASLYTLEDSINQQRELRTALQAGDYDGARVAALGFGESVETTWPLYDTIVSALPESAQDTTDMRGRRQIVACNFVRAGGEDQLGTRLSGPDEPARETAAAAFLMGAGKAAASLGIGDDGPSCGEGEMDLGCARYRFVRLGQTCLDEGA